MLCGYVYGVTLEIKCDCGGVMQPCSRGDDIWVNNSY